MKKVILISISLFGIFILAGCRNGQPANTVFTPADVTGREIGVLYGSSSPRYADELGSVTVYYATQELMDALKSGTIDCIIMEKGPADALSSKTAGVKLLSEPLLDYDLCFAIAKENADLTKAVNSALAALSENSTLKTLSDKHILGKNSAYTPPDGSSTHSVTLTLVVPGDFPPYSYKNESGEYIGLDIDVARAVCETLGVGITVTEASTKNLVTDVQFGKADLALGGLYDNEADRELVDFSNAYTHFTQAVIVRK